jgi:hypothetical protein
MGDVVQLIMCEEDRKWYFLWLAWAIDMSCFVILCMGYMVSTVLIFYFNRRTVTEDD